MVTAFVLLNCDVGSEKSIADDLKRIDEVREVYETKGPYDVVAKLESKTPDGLRDAITWKIRKMDRIRSTLTLLGSDRIQALFS